MKRIAILSVLLCLALWAHAQTEPPYASPDSLTDRFGNSYSITDIAIYADDTKLAPTSLDAGLFRLYLEDENYLLPEQEEVLVKVFTDLSYLVGANELTSGHTGFVNILIQAMPSNMPAGVPAAANLWFYEHGSGATSGLPYEYINTGVDPTAHFGVGEVYHGLLQLRNTLTNGENWYIGPSSGISAANHDIDFYTTMLHEAMHILGFYSTLMADGRSFLSDEFDVTHAGKYTWFDMHLYRYNGSTYDKLIDYVSDNCYDIRLNPSITMADLYSGCDVRFIFDESDMSDNQTVYTSTSNQYEQGSSFSHFLCTQQSLGLGYLMTKASSYGEICRHPHVHEVRALQAIGYDVSWNYGIGSSEEYDYNTDTDYDSSYDFDNIFAATTDYGYVCEYGGSVTIPVSEIIANDVPYGTITGIACPELVVGGFGAHITENGDISTTGGSLTFSADGVWSAYDAYIKYRPVNNEGKYGDQAYIKIFVNAPPLPQCNLDVCNLICNGSFDNYSVIDLFNISNFEPIIDGFFISNWHGNSTHLRYLYPDYTKKDRTLAQQFTWSTN